MRLIPRASLAIALALLFRPADARADAPATQPAGPGKLMVKVVVASSATEANGPRSEQWIQAETKQAGLPLATDCGEWVELGEKATKLDTSRQPGLDLEGRFRRDPTSKLLMVDLSGGRKKSFMMPDRIGQRDVVKLDAAPGGGAWFVAMEVAPPSVKAGTVWGEPNSNVRMNLRVDPDAWSRGGTIQFLGLFENVTPTNTFQPWWAMSKTAPVEISDEKGRLVPMQTSPAAGKPELGGVGAPPLLPGSATQSAMVSGEFADSTLTMLSSTGTKWQWKLPPGEYQVRAVADFHDHPYTGGGGYHLLYSQSVTIKITASTSQPDGK